MQMTRPPTRVAWEDSDARRFRKPVILLGDPQPYLGGLTVAERRSPIAGRLRLFAEAGYSPEGRPFFLSGNEAAN